VLEPQLMPAGLDVTVPEPVPAVVIVSWFVFVINGLNVAVTALALLIVTIQIDPLPAQAPPQPLKLDPKFGMAESLTTALLTKELEHIQLTPEAPQ
jgi:hypothetical protein